MTGPAFLDVRWRGPVLFSLFAFGCSRTPTSGDGDGAPPVHAQERSIAALDAGPKDAGFGLTEAEHAYEGKLGANTRIALELTRRGDELRGSYRYVAIGRPIALAGKLAPDDAIVLTESVNGKTTGTLRLRPSGAALIGEWSDPTGKAVFPVNLTHMRTTRPGLPSLTEQAQACLEDLACSASEAARLFVEADDVHEPQSECYRFLDGAGVPRDPARGRACLERAVTPCEGSSAFAGRAVLATMRVDGVGGPTDIAGARALFATCSDDLTKEVVLAHALAKEADARTPALDFCARSGTTITWEECAGRRRENARTRGWVAAKTVAASLDGEGSRLFRAANKAYDAYVRARVVFIFEVFAGGSVRTALATQEDEALSKKRADDLASFASFKAKPTSEADATRAAKEAESVLATMGRPTPALATTDTTWRAYRDAELAFYDHVHGATQGHDEVRRTLTVKLAARRAAECAAPPL